MRKQIKLIILLMVMGSGVIALNGCSGFTKEEKGIIKGAEGELLHIYTVEDPEEESTLRKLSTDITIRDIKGKNYKRLAERMIQTVRDSLVDGVGLAAPQIGINRRIVAVQRFDKEGSPFEVYPNIRIESYSPEKSCGNEGCLSVPERSEEVLRSDWVIISYIDPKTLLQVKETVTGFTAVIFQHEVDHLEGVLYIDLQ